MCMRVLSSDRIIIDENMACVNVFDHDISIHNLNVSLIIYYFSLTILWTASMSKVHITLSHS